MEKLSKIALEEDSFAIYELSRSSIHVVYSEMDDFIGLANAFDKSQEFANDTINSSLEFRSGLLDGMASLYRMTGDLKEVLDMRLEAIEQAKNIGEVKVDLPKYYANLAVDLNLIGDFVRSREYSVKSLSMLEGKVGVNYKKAFFYLNLGKLDARNADFESSICNFIISIEFLDKVKNKTIKTKRLNISCRQFLADTYIKNKDFDRAKLMIEEVDSLQSEFMYREYRTFEILGNFYFDYGCPDSALVNIKKSIRSISNKKIRGSEVAVRPRLLLNLANYYFDQNEFEDGVIAVQEGLCCFVDTLILKPSFNPPVEYLKYTEIAYKLMIKKTQLLEAIYRENKSQRNYQNCISAFQSTLDLLAGMRKKIVSSESKFYVLERTIPVYRSYLEFVHNHYVLTEHQKDKTIFYEIINETKSAILSDNISYKNIISMPDLSQGLVKSEKVLRLKKSLYQKQVRRMESQDSIDVTKLEDIKDSLFSFNQDYDILDKKIREAHAEAKQWNLRDNLELEELKDLLNEGEMLIDYYTSDEYIYSVAVFDDQLFVNRIILSDIQGDLNTFIEYVTNPPSAEIAEESIQTVSENITNTLLKPYLDNRKNVKSLRILPSGILNALPFEALSYQRDGEEVYLVEDCSVLYSVSRSQLLQKEELNSTYDVMAVAPVFDSEVISDTRYACDGAELSNLKHAQAEVNYINQIFDVKPSATEGASYFLENASKNDICHLATHGCINATDPMLSEIFFNDEPVTGYDVMNLDADISLMFLSACNTAKGQDVQGEGVIGLTSGFFEAGVKNMISSLWSIDDFSSSQIVKGFYKNLNAGQTYSQALRSSKLEYLESADKLRSHPYYWAGLVQIGAGVTVEESSNWWMYLLGFGMLVLLFLWNKSRR